MRRTALSLVLAPAAVALALAAPARADVPETVAKVILPGYAGFARATQDLATTAATDCTPEALRAPWNAAFDAWLGVQHVHIGPAEEDGRALAIAFWPDPKNIGGRQTEAMLQGADPALVTPEGAAQLSVAARGLFGLERLLYGPASDTNLAYACDLRRALAADLARMAQTIEAGWKDGVAETVLSAGSPGNTTYLSAAEARQALFTQLIAGLEFNADTRIGRPLGSFDHPRPERAEARASGRSLRDVALSLKALRAYAGALVQGLGPIPATEAAFDRAETLAAKLDDPVFAGVADPGTRLKLEILQQAIQATRETAETEVGALLGVRSGFNSADGD
ncbi:hypothetical protein SDC9_41122 [bioreactor metagenome]|uniref:Imelysin-like domain-containing protein n=1 Tax=bioreactor metagenome TaxID=1076179 RepID=A0A644VU79_9ZZZZ